MPLTAFKVARRNQVAEIAKIAIPMPFNTILVNIPAFREVYSFSHRLKL